jgi:hypothetical protein
MPGKWFYETSAYEKEKNYECPNRQLWLDKATIGANVALEHGGNLRCFIESYLSFFETKFRLLMMTKNSSYNPFCLGIQNKHEITDPSSCASKTIK